VSAYVGVFAAGVALALPASLLRAELVELTASVQAESEQIVDGQQAAYELGYEEYPTTTNILPEEAEVGLRFEEGGLIAAQGSALAVFSEPTLDASGNPQEIGISGVAFSTSSDVHHIVKCKVIETREFFFDSAEAGQPDGTEIEVTSTLFPSGGLVIWGEPGVTDLSGASAKASLTIVQIRAGQETTLATIEVKMDGHRIDASNDVPATLDVGVVLNGLPLSLTTPVESPSGPLAGRVGGQGEIPAIPLDFTYTAIVGGADSADAPFTLEARVEGECVNGPHGGIGAGFILGGPLFGSTTDTSDALARVISDTVAEVDSGRPIAGSSPLAVLGNLCGALGAETAMLALLLGVVCVVRSRP